jgi:hypothetical protein
VNDAYPPLSLPQPQAAKRRPDRPRPIPTAPEVIQRRHEIALRLREQLKPLSDTLRGKTDAERKAIFYKLEHDGPISLVGTDLKPIAEPTDYVTLAIPRKDSLDKLTEKVNQFESGAIKYDMVPNAQLSRLQIIAEGQPKDRLSQEVFDAYDTLTRADWVVCEIEMLSVATGDKNKRAELAQIRHDLMAEFGGGVHGVFFEHEEIKGTCRAAIRCTGKLFQRLVEGTEWQMRITWFEARPEFETFFEAVRNFSIEQLGAITGPPADAAVVCVVDSGISSGNPFLQPVTRQALLKSFLKGSPQDPSDEYGHGSGVASLVAYYALNLAPGGLNQGRVWISGARILNSQNETDRLLSVALKEVVEFFAPLGVKIFNLSVNARNLRWNRNGKRTVPRGSWTARRIDHLSKQHDVVFVISTGNIIPINVKEFIDLGKQYPRYLTDEDACIHDPGQAALAITVGAVSSTTLTVGPSAGRARAIAEKNQAAPFTRCGPGVRREVKPELIDYGGNYAMDEEGGQIRANPGLSVMMASNRLTPAIVHDTGTSFAAPLVSHKLATVLNDLRAMGLQPSAALLRAFLVNSAQYPLDEQELTAFLAALQHESKKAHLNILGYGVSDSQRATYCDDYAVVSFYQGTIEANNIVFLDIPVPSLLEKADRGVKRLTVTVVHTPDVQRWDWKNISELS